MNKPSAIASLSQVAKTIKPSNRLEARNIMSDVADIIKRVRVVHAGSPEDEDLRSAQEALFSAMRKIEASL